MVAALITEVVMTMMFLLIILGATDKARTGGFRAHCNWARSYLDSLDQHSGYQYLCEPGTQYRGSDFRW